MRFLFPFLLVGLVGCAGTGSNDRGTGGSGGQSGNGGSGGGYGGLPTDCGGTMTFRMLGGGPAQASPFCVGAPGACIEPEWLQILDGSGNTLSTSLGCSLAACSDCIQTGCPDICWTSYPLQPTGIERTWNGVSWQGGRVCGTAVACAVASCAPAGSYVARMCGYALVESDGGLPDCMNGAAPSPTCVEVPFEYPSSENVQAVLDPSR